MNFKNFLCATIIYILIFIPSFSFADDYIENDVISDNFSIETSTDLSKIPNINARHAVVFDRASGTVLYGKSENEKCKMASTTKIMTALVVLENCSNLNETVTVSKKAARNWWIKIGSIC